MFLGSEADAMDLAVTHTLWSPQLEVNITDTALEKAGLSDAHYASIAAMRAQIAKDAATANPPIPPLGGAADKC